MIFRPTVAALLILAGSGTAEATGAGSATAWELKGLKLGMTVAEVLALLPSADCKEPVPGIRACFDDTQTFAGGKAKIVTKFLDGNLIYVAAKYISYEQAETATAGLVQKYGAPTSTFPTKRWVGAKTSTMQFVARTNYVWKNGDAMIVVTPFDEHFKKNNEHFSAVTLMLKDVHDREWAPRLTGQNESSGDI